MADALRRDQGSLVLIELLHCVHDLAANIDEKAIDDRVDDVWQDEVESMAEISAVIVIPELVDDEA